MKLYWISWYESPEWGEFRSTIEAWCTGQRCSDDYYTICAWVKAKSEEQAKEIVYSNYNDYKINPSLIEWRFCNEKPLDTPRYTDRFKKE